MLLYWCRLGIRLLARQNKACDDNLGSDGHNSKALGAAMLVHFGPDLNISIAIGWIIMNLCSDLYTDLMRNWSFGDFLLLKAETPAKVY